MNPTMKRIKIPFLIVIDLDVLIWTKPIHSFAVAIIFSFTVNVGFGIHVRVFGELMAVRGPLSESLQTPNLKVRYGQGQEHRD
ncbi:hypothetical protein Scep_010130 [Stephania cephalantha]|uniref:Uncharacterized protein n=1 Tax=Stephania cephalantha TaxID=152367 RepID=A0AAP0JV89_9MAGN